MHNWWMKMNEGNQPYISGIGFHEGTHLVNITPLNSILVNFSVIEGSYLNGEQ